MNECAVRRALLIVPAVVVALFELIRHTPWVLSLLPMETSNWITAVLAGLVTALISRRLFSRLDALHDEIAQARERELVASEHKRMAEKLHDDIGQTLFFIGVQLNHARIKLPAGHPASVHLGEIEDALREVDNELRKTILDLRPGIGDSVDEHTWKTHLEEFAAGFGAQVVIAGDAPELAPVAWPVLAAICREAVVNAVKHGAARRVFLTWTRSGGRWELIITDDGQQEESWDRGQKEGHYGVTLMHQRAASIGTEVRFERTLTGLRIRLTPGGTTGDSVSRRRKALSSRIIAGFRGQHKVNP
ncbi:MAG: hypothetical protein IMX06_08235 [Kyrpidia tusciae]|nr:histidine kinase [Kyrpidia tusciae]MBE3552830.1 hypothetical protein [Kyrpidia tusciae]